MLRSLAVLLLTAMSLPFMLTGVVLIRFQVERERIIRDVCVQRARPVEENCCKGSCQLQKELKASATEQEDPAMPRLEVRMEPGIMAGDRSKGHIVHYSRRDFAPEMRMTSMSGFVPIAEPVPWA